MSDECHISSLIVHCDPASKEAAKAVIEALSGAEVHAIDERGKLIVVIEANSEAETLAHIDRINEIEGVYSTALVYHHSESAQSLEEEMNHADDSARVC
ncbi:MAG: chaperone NapD [Gammaproteobacteria bacterium]|jgi:nitrate reductase NapD